MLQRLRNNLAWALQWNRIPALPLCLEASRLSCMCISSHRPSSQLRVQELVCDSAACDVYAISQQPSAHFIYPCKVHFTLLPLPLSSPCGVLPLQAAWVRGVGGLRGSDGWRKKKDEVCCWVRDRLRGHKEVSYVWKHRDMVPQEVLHRLFPGH